MNVIVSTGAILLAALTAATLQLSLGALLSLYHASKSRHISEKTRNLVGSYIAGVGTITLLSVASFTFLFERIFAGALNSQATKITIYILFAVSILMLFFYYRRGQGTELWIPRKLAHFINSRAKSTEENAEAFSLGLLTSLAEYPFTIILFVVTSNSMLKLDPTIQLLMWAIFTIISILPLIIFRYSVRHGKTVVDVQRWRINNKTFFRILTTCCYVVLALFLIAFEVM